MIKRDDDDDDPFRLAPLPEKEEEDATRVVVVALEELVHAKQLMIAKKRTARLSVFSVSLSIYIICIRMRDEKGEYRSAFLALKCFGGIFFCLIFLGFQSRAGFRV
jgi:hypothetical protein